MDERTEILVVDDEPGIREGCRRVLVAEGYSVDVAKDGLEGAAKVRGGTFAAVLVDLRLPGLDGLDLLKIIREQSPDTACVVITGFGTLDRAVEATKRGAWEFISKPFTPDELNATLGRALERRRLGLEARRLREQTESSLLNLITEKSRLRSIINCMVDGVLVTNRDGQLVLTNPTVLGMLGLDESRCVGRPASEAGLMPELAELIDNPSSEDEGLVTRELVVDDAVLMANVAPVRDEQGAVIGAVAVLRDITRLKEIDRVKSQFVRMVAHELRAPLGAISQYMDVLLNSSVPIDPQRQKNMLHRCQDRTHGLLGLIDDLLDLSTIEAGRAARNLERLRVGSLLAEVVEVFRPQAEARDITLALDVPIDEPTISADPQDIGRVFTNLIGNAIKYNRDGGSVRVAVSRHDDMVRIDVRDSGYGIPIEAKDQLFEEFFRVNMPATERVTGTGLGLAIVKRLVEAHEGIVSVESELGRGSTFTVLLPAQTPIVDSEAGAEAAEIAV
ncbi:MAG: sensor histidine kinase [Chloroflexota bacterium]